MRYILLISAAIIALSLFVIIEQSFTQYETAGKVYEKHSGYMEWLLPQTQPTQEKEWVCGTCSNERNRYHTTPDKPDGKALFMQKCASCHNSNMRDRSTGPALGGVRVRWVGREEKLYQFIRNFTVLLEKKDPYTLRLYKEYESSNHTAFPNLTDDEIAEILRFVESRS